MLGEEVRIVNRTLVPINRMVEAEFVRVVHTNAGHFSEDEGRIFLYPVADGIYYLHLLFITSGTSQPEICWVRFQPEFFSLFDADILSEESPFRFDQTTEQQFYINSQIKIIIEDLRVSENVAKPLLHTMGMTELALQLLRKVIAQLSIPFNPCPVPACRFLANDTEREKIFDAQKILEQTIDHPLTIKELSRKVAMNECYLKKGFKTLFGKTINEYQQELRILRAKELLSRQGSTVSDVAHKLGYSSISHFSTAFKKATGIKPCELLLG